MKKLYLLLANILIASCILAQHNSTEIALIGSKISMEKIADGYSYIYDTIGTEYPIYLQKMVHAKYELKYVVKDVLYGNYQADTISFNAYTHYNDLEFTNFNNVLLFLYHTDSSYVALSDRYIKVFEDKENRWISDYHLDGCNVFSKDVKIPVEKMELKNDSTFIIPKKHRDLIGKYYPSPYYVVSNDKATVVYGYYVDDLLKILSGKIKYRFNGVDNIMYFD